jgi:gluconolactonase
VFAPPPVLQTEIFAELPAEFRKPRRNPWSDANRAGAPLHSFLEGPSFDREGNLYIVDIPYGRVFRVSPEGKFALLAEYDGEPNGLKIHKDGRIFLADYRNGILELDPKRGTVTPIVSRRWSEHFKGPNDLFFAANGDMYFTDQGQTGFQDPTGRLYRYNLATGRLDLLLGTVPSPNGLVMNVEENVMFVAVTRGNCVWRMPILGDGTVTKVGLFVQLSGGAGGGPDGLAIDEAGNLAVCHASLGVVWVFDKLGVPIWRINSCAGILPTNLAFGGPGRKTLYITESESGSIMKVTMPVAGKAMYSHQ